MNWINLRILNLFLQKIKKNKKVKNIIKYKKIWIKYRIILNNEWKNNIIISITN